MASSDDESRRVQVAVQQAVNATATAYTEDAGLEVEGRLADELASRGVELDDDEWLSEAAHQIRSGHHVVVDPR